jgi:arylsulfatase A-like enzyme
VTAGNCPIQPDNVPSDTLDPFSRLVSRPVRPLDSPDSGDEPRALRWQPDFESSTRLRTKEANVPGSQPNILVIWGDDIGITNLSCYSDGLMGYRTPNIDRIAEEGMRFTDSYGEQSCTAGRSSFITGQSVFRTGLSKVGIPGADVGLRAEDVTIAELLKPLGYSTGQFGKNHLGDKNEFLPTVHGFDEFFGNLYHLNAEEEPELPNWPSAEDFPRFNALARPRGVIHSWATDEDDDTEDGRYGRRGKQRIEDTGPLTKKRMETIDDETADACIDFITRQHEAETPFFVWMNTTHMHFRTHTKPESLGQAGRWQSPYHDTMIDHDKLVGRLLDMLDELGIADDTIVVYSTDNGPHMNTWPDGGMTPFRSEKNTNWEGAFRIPEIVRWPGHIAAGVVSNEIIQHHDWLPTFLAAAGDTTVVDDLKSGKTIGDVTYKVHIDGYNLLPYLTGETEKSPRIGMVYFSDDGDVLALRFDNWKVVFMEQRVAGTLQVWAEPFVPLRVPLLFNLRTDPFERATITSNTYYDWLFDNDYLVFAAQIVMNEFLDTFREFPPRQKAASFSIDQAVAKLNTFLGSN